MKTSADLGKDPVSSLVLRLAIPAMIAQFVNVLYSIIDRMYIGHIPGTGALALAGVGVCGPIVTLLSSFGTLVGLGGSILLGIRMGEGNLPKARQILSNSFLMLCGFSVILTTGFLFMKDHLLIWFGASEITFPYADTYMTIYTAGTFFALMAAGLNYFINCQFPVAGMMTVLIGAISNIILDPVFIFLFHMDVAGAAIATVISQMASCAFALLFLFSKKVHVRISFGNYSRKLMLNILYLGMSPFLILATDSILLIVMNTVLQKYGGPEQGDMLITCATIVQSYMLLITSPMIGISGGTQAIISYNYGAGNAGRVKSAFKLLLKVSLCYSTILWGAVMLFPDVFAGMFTTEADLIVFTRPALRIYMAVMLIFGIQMACQMTFNALGRAVESIVVAVMRKFILLLPLIYIMPLLFSSNKTMAVYLAEPAADLLAVTFTAILFTVRFKKALQTMENKKIQDT